MASVNNPPSRSLSMIFYRMAKSARFDGATFRSLREDASATGQAVLALALAGFSLGLGYRAWTGDDFYGILLGGVLGIVLGFFVGFVWLSLTFLVVTRIFKGASSFWNLGRPIFFASSPAVIFLLMLIPGSPAALIVYYIALIWIALANVFAIKNAMGFDNQRSFMTFIIVAFVLLVVDALVHSL